MNASSDENVFGHIRPKPSLEQGDYTVSVFLTYQFIVFRDEITKSLGLKSTKIPKTDGGRMKKSNFF